MSYPGSEPLPELTSIVMRCLSKNREDRYASIAELVAALAPLRAPAPSAARESVATARRVAWLGLGIGVVLLATGLFWVLTARDHSATDTPTLSDTRAVHTAPDPVPVTPEPAPAPPTRQSTPNGAGERAPPPAARTKHKPKHKNALQIGELLPP